MFNLTPKSKLATETNHLSDFKNKYSQLLPDSKISRVLIADEEAEVREALSVAVRRWAQEEQRNVQIIVVENGRKAVDYVTKMSQTKPLFLVILDLRMPEMNGLEAAETISDICPELPIIITASHDEIDEKLIHKADEFADKNTHMGFVIRTNSSHLLKVALEFEIAKLEIPQEEREKEELNLFGNLKDKLSTLLN